MKMKFFVTLHQIFMLDSYNEDNQIKRSVTYEKNFIVCKSFIINIDGCRM